MPLFIRRTNGGEIEKICLLCGDDVPQSFNACPRCNVIEETFAPLEELDPNGTAPHTSGAKLDAGKPRVSLVLGDFSRALTEVANVGTFGANKYIDHGWLDVPNGIERYDDAKLRHYLKRNTGETHDPDSGLLHAAHEAWNALAVLELMLRQNKI